MKCMDRRTGQIIPSHELIWPHCQGLYRLDAMKFKMRIAFENILLIHRSYHVQM